MTEQRYSLQKNILFLIFYIFCFYLVFFFFKQKTAYEIKECDWSSDVCSSDLNMNVLAGMSFNLLVVVIFGFLSAGLIKLHMDTLLTGLTILAAGGITAAILFRRLGKYAEHRYGYELEMD